MRKLLLIDRDVEAQRSFRRIFDSLGIELTVADGTKEALLSVSDLEPDALLMNLDLGDTHSLEGFNQLRQSDGRIPIIIISSPESILAAIAAIRQGAYDYLLKPFDIPRLQQVVLAALEASSAMKTPVNFETSVKGGDSHHVCLGHSPAMQQVFARVGPIAQDDIPVLITGEPGTGKQFIARAIYQRSRRNARLFLSVNCSSIPAALVESELFGNERNGLASFAADRIGRFEQCNQGTVLLNEICDLSLALQQKLLHLIRTGIFERANGTSSGRSDVRLVATSSRSLEEAVAEKLFHPELLSAFNHTRIHIPPLRERKEDIRSLVTHHTRLLAAELGQKPRSFSHKALAMLEKYHWPGNVRELREAIKSALAVATGPPILPEYLNYPFQSANSGISENADTGPHRASRKSPNPKSAEFVRLASKLFSWAKKDPDLRIISAVERELVINAMVEKKGNQVQAAQLLGITRATLRKRMAQFHIERERVTYIGTEIDF